VLLLVLLLGACSSSGKLALDQAKSGSIPPGKTVSLIVESDKDDNSVAMIQRLRGEMFGRLVSEAVFKHVLHPQETGDYTMKVQVLDTNEVSQGARIFFGVLAGANKLRCSVQLVEQRTGNLVTSFQVEGESAAHPFSTENGKDDAIREVVTKIIVALQ